MNFLRAVQLIPATREHWLFIDDSFRGSLRDLSAVPRALIAAHRDCLQQTVFRHVRGNHSAGRTVILTPVGHPETFLGWASEDRGGMVFCYVAKHSRGNGFARHMVASMFDRGPVRLAYWTETAERAREQGFPIEHDWREYQRRERIAEASVLRKFHQLQERPA